MYECPHQKRTARKRTERHDRNQLREEEREGDCEREGEKREGERDTRVNAFDRSSVSVKGRESPQVVVCRVTLKVGFLCG